MNILSAIGYNTQSNLKTAAGCGTEREQRHSTGGILKWQKIMRVKTRQKTIRLTKLPTAEMQWTAAPGSECLRMHQCLSESPRENPPPELPVQKADLPVQIYEP